jgi:hypothetical protein
MAPEKLGFVHHSEFIVLRFVLLTHNVEGTDGQSVETQHLGILTAPPTTLLAFAVYSDYHLLYIFIQIVSHVSRTPLSITKFGRGHASPEPLLNLQAVT